MAQREHLALENELWRSHRMDQETGQVGPPFLGLISIGENRKGLREL